MALANSPRVRSAKSCTFHPFGLAFGRPFGAAVGVDADQLLLLAEVDTDRRLVVIASTTSGKKAKSNPELNLSFDGLNHRQQRLANGGNQFSVEPPDQGLCVGNGFVMETVNDVIRVFDTAGNPLTGVVDQNSFYGYPPAINRPLGVRVRS